jgi:predicted ATPase
MEERLIIKNFGPIKHIDIPIRKVNVLIGNQGTGKSTVAKVLAIVKDLGFIINPNIHNSLKFYYIHNYINNADCEILFTSTHYTFHYINKTLNISYSAELKSLVNLYKSELENNNPENISARQLILNDVAIKISLLIGGVWYVPTERSIISSPHNNTLQLNQNYFKRFADHYTGLRSNFTTFQIPFLNIKYSFEAGRELITTKTGTYNLSESASGFQSIVPIMLLAQQFVPVGYSPAYFIIEEPELNLFPNTQRDLINYLIAKVYPLNDYMFFTTHSPYILSSINNLLYAYKIGKQKPAEVNEIIDEKYWLNSEDVSAYILTENGKAEDLMDYDNNQLKAEQIDEVSRSINNEFDKLLKLEFSKK